MSELSIWAKIRAALVAIALFAHGLYAAPVPHVVTARDFDNPVSQDEVEAWASRLQAVGVPITVDQLKEQVILWTGRIGGAHKALKGPFGPFLRVTGTGQGWGLFANPDTHPTRLEIRAAGEDGRLEPLYLQLDSEAQWAWRRLAYRRVRGCYDAQGPRKRSHPVYRAFTDWIASLAFAEHPQLQLVEVSLVRTHTTLPSEEPDPMAKREHPRKVRREAP
jgi:hypothetical protein